MNMMSSFVPDRGWTPENVEILSSMWIEGKSTREIARAVGDWCSRNAVIGKAHRIGLPGHINSGNPLGRNQHPKPARPRKARGATTKTKPTVIPVPGAPVAFIGPGVVIPILGHHHCRFIEGEPTADALYCGAPVKPDSPYCAHHHYRCFVPVRRRAA